jgi:hypothetical protein
MFSRGIAMMPFRNAEIGTNSSIVKSRRGLEKARIPDRLKQIAPVKPRRRRRRFERGPDPARCLTGRPIGRRDSYPRVAAYCKHCK